MCGEDDSLDSLLDREVFAFRIYGDNIDECIRFGEMLTEAGSLVGLEWIATYREYSAPVYCLRLGDVAARHEELILAFQVCGRYREWDLERRPYLGDEDTDVILTFVGPEGGPGKLVLGIEFNEAIPAGNNAWQRFPRIAHAAELDTPFLYSIPVCDAEVKDEEVKSIRHPNTAISLAQLVLMDRFGVPSLTVYQESPWYHDGLAAGNATKEVSGEDGARKVAMFALLEGLEHVAEKLRDLGDGGLEWVGDARKELFNQCLGEMFLEMSFFVERDFSILAGHPVLSEANRADVLEAFWSRVSSGKPIGEEYRFYDWDPRLIKRSGLPFRKAMSTDSVYRESLNEMLGVTQSAPAESLEEFAERWGIGIPRGTSKPQMLLIINDGPEKWRRPLSYKKRANEIAFIFNVEAFAEALAEAYPRLEGVIVDRVRSSRGPVALLPIAGYVQDTGGIAFSRPDKGVLALMAVLFGSSQAFLERIALMYHPEIPRTWREGMEAAVAELEGREVRSRPNNLWRETARFATIVIIDHLQEGWLS